MSKWTEEQLQATVARISKAGRVGKFVNLKDAKPQPKEIHVVSDNPKRTTKRKEPIPTEHDEQCVVIAWANEHPIARWIYAVPNGMRTSIRTAIKARDEGLRAGMLDLCLPVPSCGYHGLYIEMKRTKGGVVSEYQDGWIAFLSEQGYCVKVCKGAQDAIQEIKWYLTDRV